MSAWDKVGLNEFKRKVREGKIYLETDPEYDTYDRRSEIAELRAVLNKVLVWLTELEEAKEEMKK